MKKVSKVYYVYFNIFAPEYYNYNVLSIKEFQ